MGEIAAMLVLRRAGGWIRNYRTGAQRRARKRAIAEDHKAIAEAQRHIADVQRKAAEHQRRWQTRYKWKRNMNGQGDSSAATRRVQNSEAETQWQRAESEQKKGEVASSS